MLGAPIIGPSFQFPMLLLGGLASRRNGPLTNVAATPPPLPPGKNLKRAAALNLFLPGAGLIYLGRYRAGGVLAGAFLACFGTLMVMFLIGYARYLQLALSDDLLKDGRLEQLGEVFPRAWFAGLAATGLVIYIISSVLMVRMKRAMVVAHTA